MKIEQIGLNFSLLNQEEQRVSFHLYSERRALDLAKPVVPIKRKKSGLTKKSKKIKVTSEALETLKKLGLVT